MPAILVLRRGGLGDTLLMLPVLAALRRQHPAGELHFAGVLEHAEVLALLGAADRAFSSEDLHLWALAGDGPEAAAARARLARYARIVADEPAVAQAAAPGRRVQVFDPRPQWPGVPLGRQHLLRLGLPEPPPPERAPRKGAPGPLVLAPGSGGRSKCWPRARWLVLASELLRRGTALQVLVGPAEAERDDPRAWPWDGPVAFLAGLPLPRVAAELAGSAALVGNDSGTSHLAASLGVPTVAIFGPTDPAVWAPSGPAVRVVGRPTAGPPAAEPAEVLAALLELGALGQPPPGP